MALVVHNNRLVEEDDDDMDQLLNELYTAEDDNQNADPDDSTTKAPTTTTPTNDSSGGLENLGNTCYMASALQMLASATGFIESLDDEAPLRRAVTDLMRCLWNGETVRPELLKHAIDQRSPLFHGFRQQDANELLVTLLDLLDEEYKSARNEQETASEALLQNEEESPVDAETTMMVEMEEASDIPLDKETVEDERSTTTTVDATVLPEEDTENDDDSVTVATSTDSTISEEFSVENSPEDSSSGSTDVETSAKKARLSEPSHELVVETSASWRPSFSSFTLEDIGRLLHGDPADALILPDISTTCIGNEPQYKLVGGRMNTSDVILKPYSEYETEASPTLTTTTSTLEPSSVVESTTACAHDDTTPIDSYFKTSIRVKLTCDSCKYTRRHTETFWQLSLEIGSDHVEDALRRFFAPCQQEVKCEKCFCDTATQTMELEELPPYLLLHFKRFIVDVSPDYTSVSYRKDGSPVYFDDTITLSDDYAESLVLEQQYQQSPEYNLISVVHHIGASASCGHYTADAKRNSSWTRFNDAQVDRITATEAIDQSRHTAYMVLYQLRGRQS